MGQSGLCGNLTTKGKLSAVSLILNKSSNISLRHFHVAIVALEQQ